MRKQKTPGEKDKKGKHTVLFILLALILVLILFVVINANRNVKAMNSCADAVLDELKKTYTLTPIDVGNYKELKIYGIMKFDVEQYDIEGLGNLSIMRMNMGLMQMSTVVITPRDKNMPLLSTDFMYILSNRKAYMEFYDVVPEMDDTYQQLLSSLKGVLDNYSQLADVETTPAWYAPLLTVTAYKGGKPADDADIQGMLVDCVQVYLEHARKLPVLSQEAQADKLTLTVEYTDGLIEKGGISTDVFKKELGEEETKWFFDNIFFGTARN
ncbi:MAG: hypothetical protein IJ335_04420 [Lachnospiraceae bacterium]|nr:hypothetical protein [Lachnospiraceae bacterium]